jgi:putative pyruvate formate lyase activating enzyme
VGDVRMRYDVPGEVTGDGRFVVAAGAPAYLKTHDEGCLGRKVERGLALLAPCRVCPRPCRDVDRLADQVGGCRIGRRARVASAGPHLGEEDVLRGWNGSGTIFFSGCNLRCVFCQNWQISQSCVGDDVTPERLAAMMVRLQELGCHNINLVTAEHVVPQILEALPAAIAGGLRVPLVYNTSGYDGLGSVELLDGVVDVYMPDFKLWDPQRCRRYLGVGDYPDVARAVITAMHAQVGDLVVDAQGLAVRGLLVRHLVMPGLLDDTRRILEFLAALSSDTYVNVMDQYRPAWKATQPRYAEIGRPTTSAEHREAVAYARSVGLWRLDSRWGWAA